MTKKDLLKCVKLLQRNHESIFDEYYPLFLRNLMFYSDGTIISEFSSLEVFCEKGKYSKAKACNYFEENNDSNIRQQLDRVDIELQTWNKNNSNILNKFIKKKRNKKIRIIICSSFLLVSAIAFIILTILKYGNMDEKYNDIANDIIGCSDGVFGIVFFVYELISDKILGPKIEESQNETENESSDKSIPQSQNEVNVVNNPGTIINNPQGSITITNNNNTKRS